MAPDRDELTPEEARRDHWEMLRFLAINAAFGALLGAGITFLLIWLDIGGLGTRIVHAQNPVLPAVLIGAPLALTFAAAVTASAIMLMPYRKKKQR